MIMTQLAWTARDWPDLGVLATKRLVVVLLVNLADG